MIDDSDFEPIILPSKRKRSSILRRDSLSNARNARTVSFNERCTYRELHLDGTCDVTDLLLREDMELTALEIDNQPANTSNNSFDVSMQNTTIDANASLQNASLQTASSMDITLVNNFNNSITKTNNFETFNNSTYNASNLYDKRMSIASDISSLNSTLFESSQTKSILSSTISSPSTIKAVSMISDISCNNTQIGNNTLLDAFQDTLDQSYGSYISGTDTLMHNLDALNDCLMEANNMVEICTKMLNLEVTHLLRFHRHVRGKKNPNEFALKILGVRYPIWVILAPTVETYPDEELKVKFAVKQCDLNLYPWATFQAAIKKVTRKGEDFYITRLTRNIKLFVQFLKKTVVT